MTDDGWQKLTLLSMGGLLVLAGWMGWAWIKGPITISEVDEAMARERDPKARQKIAGWYVKRQQEAKRPEWYRRLVRRWNAAGRAGRMIQRRIDKA